MNAKEIIIPADPDALNIIYNCIIEHWRMPQYRERLPASDFPVLEGLRERILKLRDDPKSTQVRVSPHELKILIMAYKIGFGELTRDGDDFHSIVGQDMERGKQVLEQLKSYLAGTAS